MKVEYFKKNNINAYMSGNGTWIKMQQCDLGLECLANGTYLVLKDRLGMRVGKILTKEDVFLEVL